MTSWSRRVSAASGKTAATAPGRTNRTALLAEAMAAGVVEEDQSALMAMANIARDRPGFDKTLEVRARVEDQTVELVFEILHDPSGPIVRLADEQDARRAASSAAAAAPAGEGGGEGDDEGIDVIELLTDTLVETPDLVAVFASVGHEALWANDAFVTVVPIRESDKIWFVELLDEWSKGHYEVKVLPALVKFGRWRGRLTLLTGDDTTMDVSAVVVAHRDRQGEIEAITLVARDMREIAGAGGDGAGAEASRFAALVETATDIIAVLDADGTIEYASPATARILGREDASLAGTNLLELVHPDDRPDDLLALARADDQGIGTPVEIRLEAADGSVRHLETVVTDLTENPAIGGIVLNARDVTERVTAVQELASKALLDVLTKLPGRVKLLDHLATLLAKQPDTPVAVLLIDLDRVRNVNEHLGREAGDELITVTAKRLEAEMDDDAFLGRLGGDEFVVILPDTNQAVAMKAATRLRDAISQPLDLAGGAFDVTASVGIALSTDDDDAEQLLRNADRAVAQAKASGRDRIEVFTEEMAQLVTRRRTVEQTLRHALDNDGVRVHYQPIVDLADNTVVAAEALLRVHDEDGALLSPAEFIEAAESSGLIARLGGQVLTSTCEQLAAWSGHTGAVPTEISVNVSPRQLADPALPTHVVEALNGAGVAPERLWLEITESILIGGQATIDASISYLRALGVRIGLDDFGAGASSLGYLKRFPLDFVKIDRSLIGGVGVNEQDTAIVRATIELAHNLGLTVVAVGVETEEQVEYLKLIGCNRAQGYRFSPPVPADEFIERAAGVS